MRVMTRSVDIAGQISEIREQIHAVHRIKGRDLNDALRKAGRFMPRAARKAGHVLVRAEDMLGHPKLEAVVDAEAVDKAHAVLQQHLASVDVAGLRTKRLLGIFAALALNILFVAVAFLVWMRMSGHL